MDFNEFEKIMQEYLNQINVKLTKKQINQFYDYMNLLIEVNKVMNLTAITDPKEIIIKHFIDSLVVLDKINSNSSIIDVGTGAGFPGIPIKIAYPDTKIVLLDSLNKRINFLNTVIEKLNLKDIEAIHGRAEDFGRGINHREKYDIAIARAVAPLNILLEYLIPFVKVNGKCICMKGSNSNKEIEESTNAIKLLNCKLESNTEFNLLETENKRSIIEIRKKETTSKTYPRKSGIPSKKPL